MKNNPDEICARPEKIVVSPQPSTMPIYPAAVYECQSATQADRLLSGAEDGFVYQRDGHPNASVLSEQCRQLQGGDELGVAFAQITSTGMSSLALALVAHLKAGDHVLLSDQLYGRTVRLVTEELGRLGIQSSQVDMVNLEATREAIRENTRMLVVETIANPLLHVADLKQLGDMARQTGAAMLVDNTFATPLIQRPFEQGADLVMESMSKILNGHGDVMMGMLCGKSALAERVQAASSSWGVTASPFDCWLASRGLATAHLRVERASENANRLAVMLEAHPAIHRVYYPGLASHPTHTTACRILGGTRFGNMISVEFASGRAGVDRFISLSRSIAFCPSLGEIATTISHPRSTSHRGMPAETAEKMGITEGLLRISCGVESGDFLENEFLTILNALD